MIQIPVIDAADSLSDVTLDGTQFVLHLSWNTTAEYWSLGLLDAGSNLLLEGLAIVPDYLLLGRLRTPSFPIGDMAAVTPDGRNTVAYDDLVNGTVALIYYEAADLAPA